MNQRRIGIILIIAAILVGSFVYLAQKTNNENINKISEQQGTCFLEDGTCLHEKNQPEYIFGWTIAAALLLFGIYAAFFDKTQEAIAEHQIKVSKALASAKREERKKDEFKAYLAGFNEDEQKIIKAIHEQEGIKQSTLKYRTGLSKTAVSLTLSSLEDRKIISRKDAGKTKEVYLIKKF